MPPKRKTQPKKTYTAAQLREIKKQIGAGIVDKFITGVKSVTNDALKIAREAGRQRLLAKKS
jgi:hypothetical protein